MEIEHTEWQLQSKKQGDVIENDFKLFGNEGECRCGGTSARNKKALYQAVESPISGNGSYTDT